MLLHVGTNEPYEVGALGIPSFIEEETGSQKLSNFPEISQQQTGRAEELAVSLKSPGPWWVIRSAQLTRAKLSNIS